MPRPGEPYYVTTPIYYVNGEPHLGHAYTTIAADVATRHARRSGADAFLLTGTDEHGQKVQQAAAAAGVSPKEWADPIAARFRELAHDIEATNDFFIRTTDPEHEAFVQRFVERMRERGDLYEGTYSGLYCTACEAFYNEDDLVDGRCPEHGTVPVFTEERNTFFRLSAYADALLERYAADPPFVLPQTRLNEVRSHVEGGLQDVSITRESVNWGVPLPWDSSQAIYVWIDALINYTSALTYARPGEDLTARLWPARWQLLGKDILRFHAVIWPAMLLSAGYELPRQLFIHGMLAGQDGHRMSKTRGNAMDYRPVADGLRAGRAALLPAARGRLRPGRRRRLLGHARPLPQRSRQRARQPRVAQHRDGDALPRRRHPGGGPCCRARRAGGRGHGRLRAALRAPGLHGRARARVGARARAQPLRRGARAVGAREERRSGAAAALDETLATLTEGVRVLAVLLWPYLPSKAPLMLAAIGEATDDVGFDRAVLGERQRSLGRCVGRAALPARRRASGVIDTHAHLQGLDGGPGAAIEEAAEAGVERIVCVGDSPELAEEAIGLARTHPGVFATVGLHPHRADLWDDALRARLDALLGDPAAVAVGECGLDYYRDRASRSAQAAAFAGQVELAQQHGKPLVIHTREAADDTLAVLREAGCAVVLHCFSLPEHLEEVVERGWYVSFAGNVTYPSAAPLAAAAAAVPAELLLLETDCPYLSPVPHRGKPNRPRYVLETLGAVAAMRGVAVPELAAQVEANAARVFALP